MKAAGAEALALQRYYRLHAGIYDATRWAFLFGREAMVRQAAAWQPRRVLEVGCGTGHNLVRLAHALPAVELVGVDLAPAMLARAERRLAPYAARCRLHAGGLPLARTEPPFDLVLATYVLSMVGDGLDELLQQMCAQLAPGGRLAVVDFESTPLSGFRRWMGVNHVHLEDRIRPRLATLGRVERLRSRRAYGGLWRWFSAELQVD